MMNKLDELKYYLKALDSRSQYDIDLIASEYHNYITKRDYIEIDGDVFNRFQLVDDSIYLIKEKNFVYWRDADWSDCDWYEDFVKELTEQNKKIK